MDASAIKAADAKVRETVEGILAQVDERKDAAIRELSERSTRSAETTPSRISLVNSA